MRTAHRRIHRPASRPRRLGRDHISTHGVVTTRCRSGKGDARPAPASSPGKHGHVIQISGAFQGNRRAAAGIPLCQRRPPRAFRMKRPTAEQREAARRSPGGRRPVMHQRWENLLFLHWTVDRDDIQRTLPRGLHADTFAGTGWIGVVPFAMRNVRPAGLPAAGSLSNFLELNVRTYVHDDDGVPGVWFYSLDCNQPLAVLAARTFFRLPYEHSTMRADFGPTIDYHSTRRGTSAEAHYTWRPHGETRCATAGSLEFFLLERYHLYATRGPHLCRGTVAHAPYEFREAKIDRCSVLPAALAGFDALAPQPQHACHADGFDVRIFALERLK
ncbi:MAG: DUF2071 domain-containing protein [Chthoniobacterales bacterium]|nr:DUF2071 domain-containing protein [Chthoniobacterales bacterium]